MDRKYFGPIEKRSTKKNVYRETDNKRLKRLTIPTYKYRWSLLPRTPSMKTREARVLDFISSYLSDGRSSKLYKKVVDEDSLTNRCRRF
jgi:predicted Zn-dependent peptidase